MGKSNRIKMQLGVELIDVSGKAKFADKLVKYVSRRSM